MCEKSSFSSDALFKNICVSLSLANWMNYTFILGWINDNPDNWFKGRTILDNEGLMRLFAVVYKETFSLKNPLSIFIKGLKEQADLFRQALIKAFSLYSPIILLAVTIYFFYYKKK